MCEQAYAAGEAVQMAAWYGLPSYKRGGGPYGKTMRTIV